MLEPPDQAQRPDFAHLKRTPLYPALLHILSQIPVDKG